MYTRIIRLCILRPTAKMQRFFFNRYLLSYVILPYFILGDVIFIQIFQFHSYHEGILKKLKNLALSSKFNHSLECIHLMIQTVYKFKSRFNVKRDSIMTEVYIKLSLAKLSQNKVMTFQTHNLTYSKYSTYVKILTLIWSMMILLLKIILGVIKVV